MLKQTWWKHLYPVFFVIKLHGCASDFYLFNGMIYSLYASDAASQLDAYIAMSDLGT